MKLILVLIVNLNRLIKLEKHRKELTMPFLGMSFGNSDNNNNSSNNNNNSILDVLYHNTMQQKKLKQEQDEQKNSLLNQMEGYVEPKDVLYSSVDDLKKMRDDLLSKNLIKPSLPLPASTAGTPNTTNPNNNQPQPSLKILFNQFKIHLIPKFQPQLSYLKSTLRIE